MAGPGQIPAKIKNEEVQLILDMCMSEISMTTWDSFTSIPVTENWQIGM